MQLGFPRGIGFLLDLFVQKRVHQGINAADEETGHTRNFADIAATSRINFQRIDISLRDFLVHVLGKEQSDIDIDALAQHLANGRNPRRCGGNFDHYILAGNRSPQTARFFDGPLRVVGQIRRNFETDVAIPAFRALVYRPQKVSRALDVAESEQFVATLGVEVGAIRKRVEKILIERAAGNGLLKNRWIRGHARQSVVVNQALEFAPRHQIAPDVVQPDRLAKSLQLFQRVDGLARFQSSNRIHDISSLLLMSPPDSPMDVTDSLLCDQGTRVLQYVVDREAELFHDVLQRSRSAEGVHPDDAPLGADISFPA